MPKFFNPSDFSSLSGPCESVLPDKKVYLRVHSTDEKDRNAVCDDMIRTQRNSPSMADEKSARAMARGPSMWATVTWHHRSWGASPFFVCCMPRRACKEMPRSENLTLKTVLTTCRLLCSRNDMKSVLMHRPRACDFRGQVRDWAVWTSRQGSKRP